MIGLRSWTLVSVSSLIFSAGCPVQARTGFADAATVQSTFDKKTKTLSVSVKLVEGVHAYAPGEKIGRPVELIVKPVNGWKASGSTEIPPGREITLKSLGKSLILEGAFTLRSKVEGGSGPIEGELHLQVCSDDACDRPRVYPFAVTP